MRVLSVSVLAFTLLLLPVDPLSAQGARQEKAQKPPPFDRSQARHKVNENLVVLVSGGLGGPYLQLANDIAIATSDGDNLRVLPVVSGGSVSNVRDVLLAKGVDLGITTTQILNDLKASGEFGANIDKQIAYIAPLTVETLHVLVGPGINSLQDLKGKKVAFNLKGSGTARFGPWVFKTLGIDVPVADQDHLGQGDAIQAVLRGDLGATLCTCQVPIPAFGGVKAESGLKLLEIPYVAAFEQDYVPATLTSAHYANLIAKDKKIQTIATNTVLITFNWPPGTERYRRIEKFVNAFFSNMDKLRQPPRHPLWREVNIGASIRGWRRFAAAQHWLDRQEAEAAAKALATGVNVTQAKAQAARAASHDAVEQERLFKEFLEWTRKQPKR